jgi:hypothetical protein
MNISPDTSFSHDGPANVLTTRHVPFPTSAVLQPRRLHDSSQPINFNKELIDITSTQQLIHEQLGSILTKLDGISPLLPLMRHLQTTTTLPTPMGNNRMDGTNP